MAVNHYFQSGLSIGRSSEQRLIEDIIIETIRAMGWDVYYIPRTQVKLDKLFGEDVLSQFTQAFAIEMYMQSVDGFEGDRDMFSKFGIQVKDKATFLVSKRRWEECVGQQGATLQLPSRPAEGDLLYFPKTNAMLEIKFVRYDDPFFQIGKYYVYTLECELFQYSAETIETGIPEIDDDFKIASNNVFDHSLLLQSGDTLLNQSGSTIVLQSFDLTKNSPLADNELLQTEAQDILDFSIINPFGEI